MRTRIRLGPFTFGRTGVRFSPWRKGTGFSIPLFNGRARSFGKIKLGSFSLYFGGKQKKSRKRSQSLPANIKEIKKNYRQAYEPWTAKADAKLIELFREGKTINELSEIFGRTRGSIRSRINKLLLE